MIRNEDLLEKDLWIRCKTKYEREGRLKSLRKELLYLANKESNSQFKVQIWKRISDLCSRREYLRFLAKSNWRCAPTLLSYLTNILTPRETIDLLHKVAKEGDALTLYVLHVLYDEPGMKEQIIEALIDINPRQSKEFVLEGLNAKSPNLRLQCIQILSNWGSKEALIHLVQKLEDPEKEIRLQVMEFLMNFEDQDIVIPIIFRLEDPEKEIRLRAAHYLGILSDSRAINPLKKCLKDPEESIQNQAQASLVLIQSNKTKLKRIRPL